MAVDIEVDDEAIAPYSDLIVELVILRSNESGLTVPVEGDLAVDLSSPTAPTGDLLEQLLDSTVRLSAADGIPDAVLDTLLGVPEPAAFRSSPWLRGRRPVVLSIDGYSRIDVLQIRHTSTGLKIENDP